LIQHDYLRRTAAYVPAGGVDARPAYLLVGGVDECPMYLSAGGWLVVCLS